MQRTVCCGGAALFYQLGAAMELLIPLKGNSQVPLYEQIYLYLRGEIQTRRLCARTRLPSTRMLSENLKVSRSTVQLAYDQLLSEGYVEVLPRKGYYVAETEGMEWLCHAAPNPESLPPKRPLSEHSLAEYLLSDYPQTDGCSDCKVDFSPRGVDLEHFPFAIWRKLNRNALMEDKKELFARGCSQGEPQLRSALADYLHRARGVNCEPEQILVGAGNEYLLMLLHQLLEPGTCIAMENPAYMGAFRVLSSLGHPMVPVSMDGFGMNVKELSQTRAQIAYVMPSHNYPLGTVMPVARRRQLLAWAGQSEGRYIIEDDYDSEFRYRGMPIPALQGMDQREKVIYLGTFSRALAPAIRVSYMVLPHRLLQIYYKRAGFYASTVSRIDQEVLYQFLNQGHFERHVNRMRTVYRAKHDCLLSALKTLEPFARIKGANAGVHVLLTCTRDYREEWLTSRAAAAGVRVYGLSQCCLESSPAKPGQDDQNLPASVILGYAMLSEKEILEGAGLLEQAWI